MKIYQLYKCGGDWEDSYESVIGSYFKKERAEEEKTKAEIEEKKLVEQSDKCNECPYLYDAYITNDKLLSYCSMANLKKNEHNNDIDCENYYEHWNNAFFEIKEVEVEE